MIINQPGFSSHCSIWAFYPPGSVVASPGSSGVISGIFGSSGSACGGSGGTGGAWGGGGGSGGLGDIGAAPGHRDIGTSGRGCHMLKIFQCYVYLQILPIYRCDSGDTLW